MTHALARLTTQYSDIEDRIRLSGEVENGSPLVLWMTHRLARRVVPAFVEWLEKQNADLPMAEVRQEMAQQAAEAGLEPQAPVKAPGETNGWRIDAIDLTFSGEAVRITFKNDTGGKAQLDLGATPLRQWLGILRGCFERGEWPLDIWPDWLMSAKPEPKEKDTAILH